ncbi:glycosyltransferase family 4 protein [Fischerella sp. JS2]|uniref:glycosyltransferase family 4 protein n=1 Tax=Fischerella sp. JS2 TaxID=2597771 RepID=UPI0028EAD0FF|nr:glycosyltransferase family 4 protein [Fischerella sp. JS2]
MNKIDKPRIALLLPTVELGAYWQPVLEELTNLSDQTILYTGRPWPGFDLEAGNNSVVKVVGNTVRVTANKEKTDYSGGFMFLSPGIIRYLFQFKPHVVFASGFSAWTILALLFKPFGKWRLIIVWDGSSPNVDFRHSKVRSFLRRMMCWLADGLMTNSYGGQEYLSEFLGVHKDKVLRRPYLVPDVKTLLQIPQNFDAKNIVPQQQHPVFLYVGRIEQRKGLHQLLKACAILKQQNYCNYTLQIVGRGPQQEELESFCRTENIQDCVNWVGWVDYSNLGVYFQNADIFIFPSLEDIWGMVVLEAMAFGKPILCSKWAGASEMVINGENGYVFDPYHPETLAEVMKGLIDKPHLISLMGQNSQKLISQHTPVAAANFFAQTAADVLKNSCFHSA